MWLTLCVRAIVYGFSLYDKNSCLGVNDDQSVWSHGIKHSALTIRTMANVPCYLDTPSISKRFFGFVAIPSKPTTEQNVIIIKIYRRIIIYMFQIHSFVIRLNISPRGISINWVNISFPCHIYVNVCISHVLVSEESLEILCYDYIPISSL